MPKKTSCLITPLEHLEIYGVPILNDIERRECFTLTSKETKALKNYKNCDNAVYFLISLIYFKLKRTLVSFRYQDATLARQHIMTRYFSKFRAPRSLPKSHATITRIENSVLQLCDYQRFSAEKSKLIKRELQRLAPSMPKQRELFKALLDILSKHRIAIPAASTIQDVVSGVWNKEHNRIINAYGRYASKEHRKIILSLLDKAESLHEIISIRQDMKGFRTHELNKEIEKHSRIYPIFSIAKIILPKLKLPGLAIEYYASLIHYYTGARLKQLNPYSAQFYLICYCFTRKDCSLFKLP